ncbi:MAG: endolytic transglycosylase MltG [Candidatus Staskawiczbacteria bacterium]|nr:endolytic transglycosylase MltG [Candidatus Staskawiczbacteria bacterium]
MNDFSTISIEYLKKITSIIGSVFLLIIFYLCFEIYVPVNPASHETIVYTVQKGWGDSDIANNLKQLGIIRSSYFFKFYAVLSLKHSGLQAGEYNLSPRDSIHEIANKMANGDVIRDNVVILEGWDVSDIGQYLESKGICKKDYFVSLAKGHEGYIFPDTYEIAKGETCEGILSLALANFDKKLTPELRAEIISQKKSIFDIVTMASMIEKEVRSLDDKKIVSGILWKRLAIDMPLQLDATIVYITGNAQITAKDKLINSPYNTYKYYGLPKGPISNPGIDSITAAIYPTKTKYWYYLTDGITHFSETLDQHNAAKAKYLGR